MKWQRLELNITQEPTKHVSLLDAIRGVACGIRLFESMQCCAWGARGNIMRGRDL